MYIIYNNTYNTYNTCNMYNVRGRKCRCVLQKSVCEPEIELARWSFLSWKQLPSCIWSIGWTETSPRRAVKLVGRLGKSSHQFVLSYLYGILTASTRFFGGFMAAGYVT